MAQSGCSNIEDAVKPRLENRVEAVGALARATSPPNSRPPNARTPPRTNRLERRRTHEGRCLHEPARELRGGHAGSKTPITSHRAETVAALVQPLVALSIAVGRGANRDRDALPRQGSCPASVTQRAR